MYPQRGSQATLFTGLPCSECSTLFPFKASKKGPFTCASCLVKKPAGAWNRDTRTNCSWVGGDHGEGSDHPVSAFGPRPGRSCPALVKFGIMYKRIEDRRARYVASQSGPTFPGSQGRSIDILTTTPDFPAGSTTQAPRQFQGLAPDGPIPSRPTPTHYGRAPRTVEGQYALPSGSLGSNPQMSPQSQPSSSVVPSDPRYHNSFSPQQPQVYTNQQPSQGQFSAQPQPSHGQQYPPHGQPQPFSGQQQAYYGQQQPSSVQQQPVLGEQYVHYGQQSQQQVNPSYVTRQSGLQQSYPPQSSGGPAPYSGNPEHPYLQGYRPDAPVAGLGTDPNQGSQGPGRLTRQEAYERELQRANYARYGTPYPPRN